MARHDSYLEWIDTQRTTQVDRVIRWAHINSGSLNLAGLQTCAAMIAADFEALQGELTFLDLPPRESIDSKGSIASQGLGRAVRIVKRPTAPTQVFLAIHYDTVYGIDHAFQTTTQIDANTLRGPGVADAKGGLAVMLTALQAFERSESANLLGWEMLINPDEEIGSPGSTALFEQAAMRHDVGLLFEPALPDGSLVGERKGSGNFAAVVRGRSAHAGRDPEQGRNAMHAVAEYIVALIAIPKEIPGVTLNVGKVEGGGPVNIVPDLAIARFNFRMETLEQQTTIQTLLDQITRQMNLRDGISLQLHGRFTAPPKRFDSCTRELFEEVVRCGADLGLNLTWRSAGGVCDGNRLSAAGLPTIDTLGPCGGNLHSDSEYLLLDSLVERTKLTALLLRRIAQHGWKRSRTRLSGRTS